MIPIGRVTRSRASIFQPLNSYINHNNVHDLSSKSDVSTNESVLYKSDQSMMVNKTEQKSKRRKTHTKETDDQNSIPINITDNPGLWTLGNSEQGSKSLVDVTNKNIPQLNPAVSGEKQRVIKKSKKAKTKNLLNKTDTTLESSIRSFYIPDNEKEKMDPGIIECNVKKENSEMTKSKRGRKKKIVLENTTIEVNKVEVVNSVDNEIQQKYKIRRRRSDNVNFVNVEKNEQMSTEDNCTKETDFKIDDVIEPKGLKKGKKVKRKHFRNKRPKSVDKTEAENAVQTLKNVTELLSSNDETSDLPSNLRSKRKARSSISDEMPSNDETSDLISSSKSKRKTKSPLSELSVNNLTVTLNSHTGQPSTSQIDSCIENNNSKSDTGDSPILTTNTTKQRRSVEQRKFSLPQRSGTFTIDDDDTSQGTEHNVESEHKKQNQYELPKRGNTFTLEENDDSRPRRNSLRFTADPALQKEYTPKEGSNKKFQNSIGKRIMKSSMKTVTKPEHQNMGLSVKKTIQKKMPAPGSTHKSLSSCKKLPNFKLIHQKLFNAMESLDENVKRKMDRAQELLNSPIVPKCARPHQSPGEATRNMTVGSTTKTQKAQTPDNSGRPAFNKIVSTNKKQNDSTSFNRFGFKNRTNMVESRNGSQNKLSHRIDKAEAKNILQNRLPQSSVADRKNQDRVLIKGVRMNKRFHLQMKMRQNVK